MHVQNLHVHARCSCARSTTAGVFMKNLKPQTWLERSRTWRKYALRWNSRLRSGDNSRNKIKETRIAALTGHGKRLWISLINVHVNFTAVTRAHYFTSRSQKETSFNNSSTRNYLTKNCKITKNNKIDESRVLWSKLFRPWFLFEIFIHWCVNCENFIFWNVINFEKKKLRIVEHSEESHFDRDSSSKFVYMGV